MEYLYKRTAQIGDKEILETAKPLESYIYYLQKAAQKNDYSFDESSINLPFDENQLVEIHRIIKETVSDRVKVLVVIGIGGSSLGIKAIYEAFESRASVKLVFLDTIASDLPDLGGFKEEEVLVNVVSKSGTTFETNINLRNLLNKYPQFEKRVVHTTGRDINGFVLKIPEKVGGRYSTLSPVGLFPLAVAGLDILSLLEGAQEARKHSLQKDLLKNPAALSAALTFFQYEQGRKTKVNFIFHPELEALGVWYRQVLAESLGKEGKGVTPIVSIGTNDLHSMLQLYLDGPDDKFTEFLSSVKDLPEETQEILKGVQKSYADKKRPFTAVLLNGLAERSLGGYMQYKMMEVMFLGKLLGVNAFDQPAIEGYKKEARKNLTGSSA
jgi:glucose-6-phosphate isomerase